MNIKPHAELGSLNTFHVHAFAEQYIRVTTLNEAKQAVMLATKKPIIVLGGGSNILFIDDVPGTVIHNQIKGIRHLEETDESVCIQVGAGELWHDFVAFCVERGYGGLENLAFIPGTVGASPVQNIGAYGVEVQDSIVNVHTLSFECGEERIFSHAECDFSYRSSIFKTSNKGQYIVTSVVFRLSKFPILHTEYGALKKYLEHYGGDRNTWTIKTIFNAVIDIRKSKLPDPNILGNAGSFFKNPTVSMEHYCALQKTYPNIPSYPLPNNTHKIPAGWLIEAAGWKNITRGLIGVHQNQALIITHGGGSTGMDIYRFSEDIRISVNERFNIELEREVNIIPTLIS